MLWAALGVALLLRGGAAWHWRDELRIDRDGYRAIAEQIRDGRGFSYAGTGPTAYRPPLYPYVLAGVLWGGEAGVAVLQVLLGVGTVWGTFLLGRELLPDRAALTAAGLVAVDPLLLRYTPQLMTETLFAFLCTLLMWRVAKAVNRFQLEGEPRRGWQSAMEDGKAAIVVGLLFGLCALCRPTIWAWAGLAAVYAAACFVWVVPNRRRWAGAVGTAAVVAAIVVSPWVIRNQIVLGKPILTTTHGGYTLLLGNNPVFYREVVAKGGGVWSGESLNRWQTSLDQAMRDADPPPKTEVERDRWHSQRAMKNIENDPVAFVGSCLLRFRRFWNVAPLTDAAGDLPAVVGWGVTAFYTVQIVLLFVGLFRLSNFELPRWQPLMLLVLSFTAVHVLYWSNTRMRSPLIPVVALLAVRGVFSGRSLGENSTSGTVNSGEGSEAGI